MCVIIIKPAGVELPAYSELKNAATCNPDGFGFVSETESYKGLNFETFYKKLRKVSVDESCIIHFRLATHGAVKRVNCHPFEKNGMFFAHNGILDIRPRNGKTDSETAFLDILYPIAAKYGLDSDDFRYAVNCIIGSSKFAFMHEGRITTFGNFIPYNGCLYSNLRHLGYYYRGRHSSV